MKVISNLKLLLKITQEYGNAHFTLSFSAIFHYFLLYSYNFNTQAVRPIVLVFFVVYLLTTLYVWLISKSIKRDLANHGNIHIRTRILGYPLILTVLVGNIFASSFGFSLVTKIKHLNIHLLPMHF